MKGKGDNFSFNSNCTLFFFLFTCLSSKAFLVKLKICQDMNKAIDITSFTNLAPFYHIEREITTKTKNYIENRGASF